MFPAKTSLTTDHMSALSINTVSTEPGQFPMIHLWGTGSTRTILKAETENKQQPNHTKFVPMAGCSLFGSMTSLDPIKIRKQQGK